MQAPAPHHRTLPKHARQGCFASCPVNRFKCAVHRNIHQATEKKRHVRFHLLQQFEQVRQQGFIALLSQRNQPQLVRKHAAPCFLVRCCKNPQPMLQCRLITDERRERIGKPDKIPLRNPRLVAEAITPSLRVGGIRRPMQVESLQPAIRSIVHGQPQDGHVIGIHHTVDKADSHPVRDQYSRAAADFLEPARIHCIDRSGGDGSGNLQRDWA